MEEKIKMTVADIPDLIEEWDYEKNGLVKPEAISWKSGKKCWWRCKIGHSWQQSPSNRMYKCGCPYCAGKKVWSGYNDLATMNPNLAKEWVYKNNAPVTPSDVTIHSGKKFYWKCSKGHIWQATVSNRSYGNGCPYCVGKKVWIGFNDLDSKEPELAKEWDYEKNCPLTPDSITSKSNRYVWWMCKNEHSWKDTPANRLAGRGCPYCSGHRAWVGYNDLETINPNVAAEWNYTKNGVIKPCEVTAGSSKKVWWKCRQGHEWQAKVSTRNAGIGCPFCSGRYVVRGKTDLATVNPVLSEEWNYEKNGIITPSDICANSEKKVWWKCSICKHEWQATPSSRNWRGTNCPACNRRNRTSFPEQAIFYYIQLCWPESINSYTEVFDNGMELDIFIPSLKIGIEYDGPYHKGKEKDAIKYQICRKHSINLIRISEVERSNIDMLCDFYLESNYLKKDGGGLDSTIKILLKKLNRDNVDIDIVRDRNKIYTQYLSRLRENSLAEKYPTVAREWNKEKNNDLTPEMFNWGTGEKVWWKCNEGHEWQATIASRTSGGVGCPICGRKKIKEGQIKAHLDGGINSLQVKRPELVEEWDFKNNIDVDISQITPKSNQKVWWICKQNHSWKATVSSRVNGGGCPYCSGRKVLKGFNDLETVLPDVATNWNIGKNENLRPDQVTPYSNKKIWWKCSKEHEWQATISSISLGGGCPYCQGRKVLKGFNDLETLKPELMKEWNYEKNGDVSPSHYTEHSGQKVWWKCAKGHEWQAVIDSRSKGHGCPFCARKIVAKKLSKKYAGAKIGKNKMD